MYMSRAQSLGYNRMPQCANMKHRLLMVPVIVWLKKLGLSDVIYASRVQAIL